MFGSLTFEHSDRPIDPKDTHYRAKALDAARAVEQMEAELQRLYDTGASHKAICIAAERLERLQLRERDAYNTARAYWERTYQRPSVRCDPFAIRRDPQYPGTPYPGQEG